MNIYLSLRILFALALCAISLHDLSAQASLYPSIFSPMKTERGAQVLLTVSSSGLPATVFSLSHKEYWSKGSLISTWQYGHPLRKTINLTGAILCAEVFDSVSFLAVLQRGDTLVLAHIDTSLSIRREQVLSIGVYNLSFRCTFSVSSGGSTCLLLGDQLFLCMPSAFLFLSQIAAPVEIVSTLQSSGQERFAYVLREGKSRIAVYADKQGQTLSRTVLALPSVDMMRVAGTTVAFLRDLTASSEVTVLMRDGTLTRSFIPASPAHIILTQKSRDRFQLHYMSTDEEGYGWKVIEQNPGATISHELSSMRLPEGFVNPLRLMQEGEHSFILFQNGCISIDEGANIHSADRFSLPVNSDSLWQMYRAGTVLLLSHPFGSAFLQEKGNSLWWLNRLVAHFWLSALAIFVVILMYGLVQKVYRQGRLIHTLFESPEADPVIVLDSECRVTKFNEQARMILHVPPTVPMKRMIHSYLVEDQVRGLQELINEVYAKQQVLSKKVMIGSQEEATDYLFTAVPVFSMFRTIKGVFLTGRNITEELERKRLANWAQLAHDMQTNLSIIRLNAEKISTVGNEEVAERGRKVLFQVNLLINRVRDLVTIGRTDTLERQLVDIADICADVVQEFDQSLFSHVTFHVEAKHILVLCDRLKLGRALRNAVENGIRALQGNPGSVGIISWFDRRYVYFEVTDNGVGMDKETQDNMMKPFFTTFGRQGGTGMGTMIMRHVVHQHGGEIFIESEKGKGTSVQFRLPNIGTYVPHIDHEYLQKVGAHE